MVKWTFSEVTVVGWRFGLTPLQFKVLPVLVVNPLPSPALTVAAHSKRKISLQSNQRSWVTRNTRAD